MTGVIFAGRFAHLWGFPNESSESYHQLFVRHYTSGSKLGFDATKKLPGEGFKRPWPPLIKMNAAVRKAIDARFGVAETEL